MFNLTSKKLTKDHSQIPLFWVEFNLNKYIENGAKNSCIAKIHPVLKEDEYIHKTINDLIDYVRNNYDMEFMS